jgi:hypothetical protein
MIARVLGGLAAAMLAATPAAADPGLRSDLEAVGRRTVLFGHQSVGNNILDGVRDLAAAEGVTLRIVEVSRAEALAPGTFAHALVAENGDPRRKLSSFEAALGPGPTTAEIALVKLCFVDIVEGTDVEDLFARYRSRAASRPP